MAYHSVLQQQKLFYYSEYLKRIGLRVTKKASYNSNTTNCLKILKQKNKNKFQIYVEGRLRVHDTFVSWRELKTKLWHRLCHRAERSSV